MANEMRDYLEGRERVLEARVAALEKFAMWVISLPNTDAALALSRVQEEARNVLK